MGRCLKCRARFLGDKRYCPKCGVDIWNEEFSQEKMSFGMLQAEAERLIEKARYEKAYTALSAAFDKIMYKKAQFSINSLSKATADIIWLYVNDKVPISNDKITDVWDFYENYEGTGDIRYNSRLYRLKDELDKKLPKRNKAGKIITYPVQRDYWKLKKPEEVFQTNPVSGYEPDISRASHLTITECFLYMYERFDEIISFIQSNDILDKDVVYNEILPMIHPDLDMAANGWNQSADSFGDIICSLFEQDIQPLVRLYMHGYDEDDVQKLSGYSFGKAAPEIVYPAIMAPLMTDRVMGEAVYSAALPFMKRSFERIEEMNEQLAATQEWQEIAILQKKISVYSAEYCAVCGTGEYMTALKYEQLPQIYMEGMETASANGISKASEHLVSDYFYGEHECEVQPGYSRFYARLVSLRNIKSSICEMAESVKDVEIMIPGIDDYT